MGAKKILKKHLDIHIPKGEYRSEKQLIQLRYDASIDAINEALTIHSVMFEFCRANDVLDMQRCGIQCEECKLYDNHTQN